VSATGVLCSFSATLRARTVISSIAPLFGGLLRGFGSAAQRAGPGLLRQPDRRRSRSLLVAMPPSSREQRTAKLAREVGPRALQRHGQFRRDRRRRRRTSKSRVPMQRLDRAEFEATRASYDEAVAADPAIDRFCSRSAWILSFHDAFRPGAELVLAREGESFVALEREPSIGVVCSRSVVWGFASPLVGEEAAALGPCSSDAPPARSAALGVPRARATSAALRVLAALRCARPDAALPGLPRWRRRLARAGSGASARSAHCAPAHPRLGRALPERPTRECGRDACGVRARARDRTPHLEDALGQRRP
jgi:hypothetical protein